MNGNYAAISAQLALQRRLDTIANNVANAGTIGFRAEQVRFATVDSDQAQPSTAFTGTGQTYLSPLAGELVRTDDPFDVAVDGNAWLAVQTPLGLAYSRDGRLQMSATGELRTITGHGVLDVGGSPILLAPTDGPPTIGRDGSIAQSGRQVGVIGLFQLEPGTRLARGVDSTVLPDRPAQPVVDTALAGLRQGFVERANVNPVTEMARLVLDQRMFEAITNAISETEQSQQSAIRALGAGT